MLTPDQEEQLRTWYELCTINAVAETSPYQNYDTDFKTVEYYNDGNLLCSKYTDLAIFTDFENLGLIKISSIKMYDILFELTLSEELKNKFDSEILIMNIIQ